MLNGYRVVSELEDVLKNLYYESPLGHDYVDWFVIEVKKLEKKWLSILKTLGEISL